MKTPTGRWARVLLETHPHLTTILLPKSSNVCKKYAEQGLEGGLRAALLTMTEAHPWPFGKRMVAAS
jgi:hypothetical protein